ncbi:DUF2809 domain-containing protein [Clostridium botulinum]|uniref:DUF2809 domain-containing protein n=1 Tax=Clostridium botulinum TaxID=1491 RepID=A0A9Q1ZEX1_CLOBO|nr:DUF2809 domain-containing protein [Clostridium botulinum]AEB76463.1 conserved hypothetical protein [Clostridium botulinum BKT015925]KEI01032.1 hypothetical protein Z953_09230 [Clostridium botulinum D str. 16868]KEI04787.1 hypothetical protein Y848_12815 [Clostridium botulinum C/D str. Sp77]KLU75976.1 hypothetical protein CBC3_05780 [Clostridium botulinum V891]KOA75463.1 hypothetical protein ADU78_08080 [Clostridium botulinum]
MKEFKRNRFIYGILTLGVMILGLFSKKINNVMTYIFRIYLGDSLWALMIFFGMAFIFRSMKTKKITLISLSFCYIIEISQLYHASWIDSIRKTTMGGLILGYVFSWRDLIAYAMGILVGVWIELLIYKKRMR